MTVEKNSEINLPQENTDFSPEDLGKIDSAFNFVVQDFGRFHKNEEDRKRNIDQEFLILSYGERVLPRLWFKTAEKDSSTYIFSQFAEELATDKSISLLINALKDPKITQKKDLSAIYGLLDTLDRVTLEARLINPEDPRLITIYEEVSGLFSQTDPRIHSSITRVLASSGQSAAKGLIDKGSHSEWERNELNNRYSNPEIVKIRRKNNFKTYEEIQRGHDFLSTPDEEDYGSDPYFGMDDTDDFGAFDDFSLLDREQPISSRDDYLRLMDSLRGIARGETPSQDYHFFPFPKEREELFQYCSEITRHLHDQGIADLVIIDRSSRPVYVGVRECWKAFYPKEKMPGIFFLNPNGFKLIEELRPDQLATTILKNIQELGRLVDLPTERSQEDIEEEFRQTYSRLLQDKDKPILIFDSCIHSGDTLAPIKQTMEHIGFSDLSIGSINPSEPRASVQTDYAITNQRPEKGCYPFDRDRVIEKSFDHVYSSRTEDDIKRAMARRLRYEIKNIVREQLTENK